MVLGFYVRRNLFFKNHISSAMEALLLFKATF